MFCLSVIYYKVKQETRLNDTKLKNTIFSPFFSVHKEEVIGFFPSRKCHQSTVLLKSNGMVVAYFLTDATRMSGGKKTYSVLPENSSAHSA
jgi:hypothetical protein